MGRIGCCTGLTVIAQFVQTLIVLIPFLKSSSIYNRVKISWKPDAALLGQVVNLWMPMFVKQAQSSRLAEALFPAESMQLAHFLLLEFLPEQKYLRCWNQ